MPSGSSTLRHIQMDVERVHAVGVLSAGPGPYRRRTADNPRGTATALEEGGGRLVRAQLVHVLLDSVEQDHLCAVVCARLNSAGLLYDALQWMSRFSPELSSLR